MSEEVVPWGPAGRKRDRDFTEALIEELPKSGTLDEKLVTAASKVWSAPMRTKRRVRLPGPEKHKTRLLALAKRKLENAVVWRGIADAYEIAADFSLVDAVRKHVEHIEAGNYQALKDYLKVTTPTPAKQVNVDQRILTGRLGGGQPPPGMRARVLGPAVVERDAELSTS